MYEKRKEADIISNSDSVLENEQIRREEESRQNEGKIELEVHLTKEQEHEQFFGSLPQEDLIGKGLKSSQYQKELRESKKMKFEVGATKVPQSQDDLLDFLDERP